VVDLHVKVVGADISADASSVRLDLKTRKNEPVSVTFGAEDSEDLLVALADALGRAGLQAAQDRVLKRVMQIEQWAIKPHPDGNGILLFFLVRGGLEATFHLPKNDVPRYEEALSGLSKI
jgi:hypothetical protein